MYRPEDPRFRRTLNTITTNISSANESAQYGLFSLSESYIKPCVGTIQSSLQPCADSLRPCWDTTTSGLESCLEPCFGQCLPARDPSSRTPRRGFFGARARGRTGTFGATRGRGIEHSFDFYDDWAEDLDENDALLALEDEEFDRVVGGGGGSGGSGDHSHPQGSAGASAGVGTHADGARQPGRRRVFDYGAAAKARRRTRDAYDDTDDEGTVIPQQSYFGFLSRLPFGIRRPVLRYQPSAADLQIRPQGSPPRGAPGGSGSRLGLELREEDEQEGLLEEGGYDDDPEGVLTATAGPGGRKQKRMRSNTQGSGHTTDSFSSRGDLFPSDEEDDAREIDDAFETELSRQRSGGDASGDVSSGRGSSGKGSKRSGGRAQTLSRKSTKSQKSRTSKSSSSGTPKSETDHEQGPEMAGPLKLPTMDDLRLEEQAAREKEEVEIEQKREAAQRLARERGLSVSVEEEQKRAEQQGSRKSSASEGPEPFPDFEGKESEERPSSRPTSDTPAD